MPRTYILGGQCTLLVQPAASRDPGTPQPGLGTFLDVEVATDVRLTMNQRTEDRSTRASGQWNLAVAARKSAAITAGIVWQPDTTVWAEIMDSYFSGCPLTWAAIDGPVVGGTRCGETGVVTGLMCDFLVETFERNEALTTGLIASIALRPAKGIVQPTWLEF